MVVALIIPVIINHFFNTVIIEFLQAVQVINFDINPMKTKIILLSIAITAVIGCKQFRPADGGMSYKIIEDKSGRTIKEGDFTALSFSVKTEEGAVLYNSNDEDGRWAFKFREKPYFKGDFFTALGLLSEGDSAEFKINIDSLVTRMGKPKPATKAKYLLYTIKVYKVIARGELKDSVYNSEIEKFKAIEIGKAKLAETAKLNHYISLEKLKPVITPSGLNYVINQAGKGPLPANGDSVEANYTAKFLSGKVIETSSAAVAKKAGIFNKLQKYGPVKLLVTVGKSLSGTQEALLLFPAGTNVKLIIPSKLAYSNNVYKNIQPYTPLICELEIISIIHSKPGGRAQRYPMPEKEQ